MFERRCKLIFVLVNSKCFLRHLSTSSRIDLFSARFAGCIWSLMKVIAWRTPIRDWFKCFDSFIIHVTDLFWLARHFRYVWYHKRETTSTLILCNRTIFQSYGLCSTLSCPRSSRVSRVSRSGSIRLSTIKVYKIGFLLMKKSNCSLSSVFTRCCDLSCFVVSRRMLNLSYQIRWNVSSSASYQLFKPSCILKWRNLAFCSLLQVKRGNYTHFIYDEDLY